MVVERDAPELVAADGGVVDRLALVGHVAEHVAVLVLRPGLAEVQPDAPVQEGQVVVPVAVDVERGDPREAAAVEQDVDDAVELRRQTGEREVRPPELEGVGALGLGVRERGVELLVVGGVEMQRPRLRIGHVGGPPLRRRFELVQRPRRRHGVFRAVDAHMRLLTRRGRARGGREGRRWARPHDRSPDRTPPWPCTRGPAAAAACRRPGGRRPSPGRRSAGGRSRSR